MLSRNELEQLSQVDVKKVPVNELQDISEIKINHNNSVVDRLELFLLDVKNPYCFKVNNTPVKISFQNHNSTLEQCLLEHYYNKIDNNTLI